MAGFVIDYLRGDYALVSLVLGFCDSVVFIISLTQLIRLLINKRHLKAHLKETEKVAENISSRSDATKHLKKLKERVLFQWVMLTTMAIRVSFFFTYPAMTDKMFQRWWIAFVEWKHVGSFFFLLAYMMLLVFWLEVYYRLDSRSQKILFTSIIDNLGKISAIIIVVLIAACVTGIALVPQYDPSKIVWKIDDACGLILGCLSIVMALLFIYYGIMLGQTFSKFRVLRVTVIQIRKLSLVVAGCTLCFIARSTIELYSIYADVFQYTKQREKQMSQWTGSWEILFLYYFVFETLPALAMCILLGVPSSSSGTARTSEKTALLN